MIHELDVVNATARCVDLPGRGNTNAALTYTVVVDPDWRQLWALSPGYGEVVAVDVPGHRIRAAFTFVPGPWTGAPSTGVLSPDGERIALSDAQHLWFVEPSRYRVVRGRPHVAVALAYAPDQSRLWVVGERSRVFSLPPGS